LANNNYSVAIPSLLRKRRVVRGKCFYDLVMSWLGTKQFEVVLRGLDPRIHFFAFGHQKTWVAGASPAKTTVPWFDTRPIPALLETQIFPGQPCAQAGLQWRRVKLLALAFRLRGGDDRSLVRN